MKNYFFILIMIAFLVSCNNQKEANTTLPLIKEKVNVVLDDWHKAASEANYEDYFGKMDSVSVFIGTEVFGINYAYWNQHMVEHTEMVDIMIAMIKGVAFGMIIVLVSCHQGLRASNGAVGVGQGTTKAMVFSSLGILIVNFFLTMLLNAFFPTGFAS